MFEKQIYEKRRLQLKRNVASGLLIFTGNVEMPMNYPGNVWPFRQDSSFLYYFGIDRPGLNAIIDIDENVEIIFGDDITIDDVVWMGPQPALQELADRCGVTKIMPSRAFVDYLQQAVQKKKIIHFLPQYQDQAKILLAEALPYPPGEINQHISEAFTRAVISQRSIKQEEEIEEMEKALAITYEAHLAAMALTRPGKSEHFVAGKVTGEVLKYGVLLSFPMIFTVRGEILHNAPTSRIMQEGQLALCDMGTESPLHYAGDVTRTFPVNGKFTELQKAVYTVVLNAQLTAIKAIKPGVKYRDVHLIAAKVIAEGLKEIGIMKGDMEDAVQAGAHALFFPHGLGHMIGLDVHDMEGLGEDWVGYDEETRRSDQFGLAYLRMAKKLEPGHVVTVEPGIYFIPALIDQWQAEGKFTEFINYSELSRFRNFGGIRIEDNVLVTAEGSRVLGEPIAKTVAAIEEQMQGS